MGLLDDAIREHLDLKRRRGADPADVARLEQEALGPVRRESAPAEPAAAEEHHEHRDEPRGHEPVAAEHAHPAAESPHPDDHTHVVAPEDRHDPPHGDPLFEQHLHNVEMGGAAQAEAGIADAERAAEPDAQPPADGPAGRREDGTDPGPARPAAEPGIVDQPTTEYRVEDHHDDEDDPPHAPHAPDPHRAEDVLEETPDFLQETPEHDRLWFEQRPPRDFDFDG